MAAPVELQTPLHSGSLLPSFSCAVLFTEPFLLPLPRVCRAIRCSGFFLCSVSRMRLFVGLLLPLCACLFFCMGFSKSSGVAEMRSEAKVTQRADRKRRETDGVPLAALAPLVAGAVGRLRDRTGSCVDPEPGLGSATGAPTETRTTRVPATNAGDGADADGARTTRGNISAATGANARSGVDCASQVTVHAPPKPETSAAGPRVPLSLCLEPPPVPTSCWLAWQGNVYNNTHKKKERNIML